jgi:hypothetical protein
MFGEIAVTILGQFVGVVLAIFVLNMKFQNSKEIEFQKSSYELGRLFLQQQEGRRQNILKISGEFFGLLGRVERFGDKTSFFINQRYADGMDVPSDIVKEFNRYYIERICADLDALQGLACSYFRSAKSEVEELSGHCSIIWGTQQCFFDSYVRLSEDERMKRCVQFEIYFKKTHDICGRIRSLVQKDLLLLQKEPK